MRIITETFNALCATKHLVNILYQIPRIQNKQLVKLT